MARFAKRRKITFTMLSDPKSEIIRAFDLLDASQSPGSGTYGIAHPMILVIDAEGVVRHRFSEATYSRRPKIEAVLDAIR